MRWTASSSEVYLMEARSLSMPSFTLWPAGNDKSTMTRHLPVVWPLGTRPIGLVWTWLAASAESGPTRRPAETSLAMWEDTTALLARADGWLFPRDLRVSAFW